MKKIYLNTLVALCLSAPCSQTFAITYPIDDIPAITIKSDKKIQYAQASDILEFESEDKFEEHELTTTGIMFYYTKDAVNGLGSFENIEKFINNSIDIGNQAYINSGIPARVQAVGLKEIYFNYNDKNTLQQGRLSQFANSKPENKYKNLKASHFVLINRFYKDTHKTLGAAYTPGNVSYISNQYNNTNGSFVLIHELAHNKGVQHKSSESEALKGKAYGSTCDYFASIMGTGRILHKFFSNPNIYINGHQCGDETHDVAGALQEEFDKKGDYLKSSQTSKIIPLAAPTGLFSFNSFNISSNEDGESIDIKVSFENTTKGASVQLFSNNSKLIKNFENPILISDNTADTKEIKVELDEDWRHSEDRAVTFYLKYPTQVNAAYEEITFNIDSFETDTELTTEPVKAAKKESGSINFFLSILLCSIALFRKTRSTDTAL